MFHFDGAPILEFHSKLVKILVLVVAVVLPPGQVCCKKKSRITGTLNVSILSALSDVFILF